MGIKEGMKEDGDEKLYESFREALHQSKDKIKLTDSEEKKLIAAMKKKEFQEMLSEYMQEISDPKHRKEQEEYLRQLERDQQVPSDKLLIKPQPGFVIKLTTKKPNGDNKKRFINVCHSDKVERPSCDTKQREGQGVQWSLPYSLGPERMETDNRGQSVATVDVCYNPETLHLSSTQPRFKEMVINTSIDGLKSALVTRSSSADGKEIFDKKYVVLKGVSYKSGEPVTMCLSKKKKENICKEKSASQQTISEKNDNICKENKFKQEKSKSCSEEDSLITKSKKKTKLEYTMIHRGTFDLGDYVEGDTLMKQSRPRELVIKINLSKLKSCNDVELDVCETEFKLTSSVYETLCVKLPYPVIESKGSAKFDKKTRYLVMTLPVQAPPIVKSIEVLPATEIGAACLENENRAVNLDNMEKIISSSSPKNSTLSPPIGKNTNTTITEKAINEKSKTKNVTFANEKRVDLSIKPCPSTLIHSRWVCNKNEKKDSQLQEIQENIKMSREDLKLKLAQSTNPIKAPYNITQSDSCISVFVEIPGIIEDSVSPDYQSNSFSVTFKTKSVKSNTVESYILKADLPEEVIPQTATFNVASENMVFILQKISQTDVLENTTPATSDNELRIGDGAGKVRLSPQFILKQTNDCITILIPHQNIKNDSVWKQCSPNSITVEFDAKEEATSEKSYSLFLEICGKVVPEKTEIDVSTDNMVVLLYKHEDHLGNWKNVEKRKFLNEKSQCIEHCEINSKEELDPTLDYIPSPVQFKNKLLYELD